MGLKRITILSILSIQLTQILGVLFMRNMGNDTLFIVWLCTFMSISIIYFFTIKILLKTIKEWKNNSTHWEELCKGMLWMKLGTIPVFMINFYLTAGMGLFILIFLGILGPIIIAIGITIAMCVLVLTSSYTILVLRVGYEEGCFTKKVFWRLVISQFIFCVDVIATIIAYRKMKNLKGKALSHEEVERKSL